MKFFSFLAKDFQVQRVNIKSTDGTYSWSKDWIFPVVAHLHIPNGEQIRNSLKILARVRSNFKVVLPASAYDVFNKYFDISWILFECTFRGNRASRPPCQNIDSAKLKCLEWTGGWKILRGVLRAENYVLSTPVDQLRIFTHLYHTIHNIPWNIIQN